MADRAASTSASREPPLYPTAMACVLLLALLLGLVGRLTQGFETWTYEALRREAAVRGALRTPPMALRDARNQPLDVFGPAAPTTPVYLVDFIFTRCLTVCQALGSEFRRMQEELRTSGAPVRLLSVSIDPRHDDAAALAAHERLHRADARLWTLAAPRSEEAGRAALHALGVVAIADGLGGFVHNGSIHLIDATGQVHAIFGLEQWPQALAAAQRLADGSAR